MAKRHQDALDIALHPYGTWDAIVRLLNAAGEVRKRYLAEGPQDDDNFDWESYIDYGIESDPACMILAHMVSERLYGWGMHEGKVAHLLDICRKEVANG